MLSAADSMLAPLAVRLPADDGGPEASLPPSLLLLLARAEARTAWGSESRSARVPLPAGAACTVSGRVNDGLVALCGTVTGANYPAVSMALRRAMRGLERAWWVCQAQAAGDSSSGGPCLRLATRR